MAHIIPQLMSPNIICQWPAARRSLMCINRVNSRPRTTVRPRQVTKHHPGHGRQRCPGTLASSRPPCPSAGQASF